MGYTHYINKNMLEVRQMNWISVEYKEKLPEDFQDVLFTDGKGVYKGYRMSPCIDSLDYWYSVSDCSIDGVTHWMPLPELPHD